MFIHHSPPASFLFPPRPHPAHPPTHTPSPLSLQGVKAVIAKSFERIHRSNLVGMGIIPLCFKSGQDADSLGLTGYEQYSIHLPELKDIKPGMDVKVTTDSGKEFETTLRFDTQVSEGILLEGVCVEGVHWEGVHLEGVLPLSPSPYTRSIIARSSSTSRTTCCPACWPNQLLHHQNHPLR